MFVLGWNWILVFFSAWCCISFWGESFVIFVTPLFGRLEDGRWEGVQGNGRGERLSWWVTVHKEGTANSLEQALSVWLAYTVCAVAYGCWYMHNISQHASVHKWQMIYVYFSNFLSSQSCSLRNGFFFFFASLSVYLSASSPRNSLATYVASHP